jgi:hypothetical protein
MDSARHTLLRSMHPVLAVRTAALLDPQKLATLAGHVRKVAHGR